MSGIHLMNKNPSIIKKSLLLPGMLAALLGPWTSACALPASSEGGGASIELAWGIPTTRQDGTLLNTSEVIGYTIYYGFAPNQYNYSIFISGGDQRLVVFPYGESGDTLYMVITAWDDSGLESGYSNTLEVTVQ
jgi:hypothetical protein